MSDQQKHWHDFHDRLRRCLSMSRFGLITDFDGTLSPIVDDPAAARITPTNRDLLARLHQRIVVTVVSGRPAADVQQRVGLEGLTYYGNHGFERWADGQASIIPEAAAYRPALEAALAEIEPELTDGMLLEDKVATLSLHYRNTSDPDSVARIWHPLLESVAERHHLRLTEGRRVFELRPPIEVDKGLILRRIVTEHQLQAALYLGDDLTDVDAFQVAHQVRADGICDAYAVGVVSAGTPQIVIDEADMLAQDVTGIEALLAWLIGQID